MKLIGRATFPGRMSNTGVVPMVTINKSGGIRLNKAAVDLLKIQEKERVGVFFMASDDENDWYITENVGADTENSVELKNKAPEFTGSYAGLTKYLMAKYAAKEEETTLRIQISKEAVEQVVQLGSNKIKCNTWLLITAPLAEAKRQAGLLKK